MEIRTFGSTEEMLEAISRDREHALTGLHPLQRGITYGDYWVQFHDLDNRHIVFGEVWTLERLATAELKCDGATWDEVSDAVERTRAQHEDGLMFGYAHDRFNPRGELGYTHKAHAWPIEKRLFDMAQAVDFEINGLDDAGRILLEIAFRGIRAHLLPNREATS